MSRRSKKSVPGLGFSEHDLQEMANEILDRSDFDKVCMEAAALLENSVRKAIRLAYTSRQSDDAGVAELWQWSEKRRYVDSEIWLAATERAKQKILGTLFESSFT